MNNEPVAWTDGKGNYFDKNSFFPVDDLIPLYTHPVEEQDESFDRTASHMAGEYVSYPVKELNEAIKIIKDFQSDGVPPCKSYEDTYADGWMDACNEILWAIEEKAQEK